VNYISSHEEAFSGPGEQGGQSLGITQGVAVDIVDNGLSVSGVRTDVDFAYSYVVKIAHISVTRAPTIALSCCAS
jgi:hypothetical protein